MSEKLIKTKQYKRNTIHNFYTDDIDDINVLELVEAYSKHKLSEGESICLTYGDENDIVLQSIRLETDEEQTEREAQEELKKDRDRESYRRRIQQQIENLQQSLKTLDIQESH